MDSSSPKGCWMVDVKDYCRDKGYTLNQAGKRTVKNITKKQITATSRRGCVEICKLRLRINLFPKSKNRTTDER